MKVHDALGTIHDIREEQIDSPAAFYVGIEVVIFFFFFLTDSVINCVILSNGLFELFKRMKWGSAVRKVIQHRFKKITSLKKRIVMCASD